MAGSPTDSLIVTSAFLQNINNEWTRDAHYSTEWKLQYIFEAKNLLLLEKEGSISSASKELFWINNFGIYNWEKNLGKKEY